jgi:hypothetical protein
MSLQSAILNQYKMLSGEEVSEVIAALMAAGHVVINGIRLRIRTARENGGSRIIEVKRLIPTEAPPASATQRISLVESVR